MSMSEMADPHLPDPLSIPLPDDIPLPPEDDSSTTTSTTQTSAAAHRNTTTKTTTTTVSHTNAKTNNKSDGDRRYGNMDEEELLAKVMGFSSFNSTKGKMVPGNQTVGAVHVVKRRRYRQYMNRKGGFNRPLDKVA